jgi:hypothetical protein
MDSLLDDIVDRSTLGYKYIGTYERWATPTLGAVFDGILCFNENGHMSLTMSDNSQSYEFYSPLQLGYDIKDHLEDFTLQNILHPSSLYLPIATSLLTKYCLDVMLSIGINVLFVTSFTKNDIP